MPLRMKWVHSGLWTKGFKNFLIKPWLAGRKALGERLICGERVFHQLFTNGHRIPLFLILFPVATSMLPGKCFDDGRKNFEVDPGPT